MSVQEHKSHAPKSIGCFVLTVSDTRTAANDTGGRAIRELLESGGHVVTGHAIVRDKRGETVRGHETRELFPALGAKGVEYA